MDIQPYVLRYWETEFSFLSPGKSKSGQRVYTDKELALIRRIKSLLYDEGYTIAGAKKRLEAELKSDDGKGRSAAGAAEGDAESTVVETVAAEDGGGADEPLAVVDNAQAERVEILEEGLVKALREVRDLLAVFEDRTSD